MRRARRKKERFCVVGSLSFAAWVVVLTTALEHVAHESSLFLPVPLTMSNWHFGAVPLRTDFRGFTAALVASHIESLPPFSKRAAALVRTHRPYLYLTLNATDLRAAPAVSHAPAPALLLGSKRRVNKIVHKVYTLLYAPDGIPDTWPPRGELCARLFRSGNVASRQWFADMANEVDGKLRPFALAAVSINECARTVGVAAVVLVGSAALLAATGTARLLLWLAPPAH